MNSQGSLAYKIDHLPQISELNPLVTLSEIQATWAEIIEQRMQENLVSSGLLRKMMLYHLIPGGKHFRAILPIWVCSNLGGQPEEAIDIGIGLELVHNATLVHDDIQDRSASRRGKASIWKKWGDDQAINTGDALIVEAMKCLAKTNLAARVIQEATTALIHVVEGQTLEFQLQQQLAQSSKSAPLKFDHWRTIARQKTGALFEAAMRLGAIAAAVPDYMVEQAGEFGVTLGLLFQAQDDYLDLIELEKGSFSGNDLMEGKPSFPFFWASQYAKPQETLFIRQILQMPKNLKTPEILKEGVRLLTECGAIAAFEEWILQHREAAQIHPMATILPGILSHVLAPIDAHLQQSNHRSPNGLHVLN